MGVHRIHIQSSLFVYEFICIWDVKSTLTQLGKQKSYSHTRKENNRRLPPEKITFCFYGDHTIPPHATLSYPTASVSHPIPLSAINRFLPFKALCMQHLLLFTKVSLNVWWQFKFKTDGTELPATDASSRSFCCTNNARLQDRCTILSNTNCSVKTNIDFTHSSYVYHFYRCKSH